MSFDLNEYAKEKAEESFRKAVEQKIREPSSFLIHSILKSSTDENYYDKVTKTIIENEDLRKQAIENYKKFMTKIDLNDDEIEKLRWYPGFFSENWRKTNLHGEVCEMLGIADEVDRAVKIRIQKLNEYYKRKEEERRREEEQEFRELEQKLKEKIHQKIKLVKKGYDYAEIKIEQCDKDTFNGIVSTLKEQYKSKFNYRTKTWTISLKNLGVE